MATWHPGRNRWHAPYPLVRTQVWHAAQRSTAPAAFRAVAREPCNARAWQPHRRTDRVPTAEHSTERRSVRIQSIRWLLAENRSPPHHDYSVPADVLRIGPLADTRLANAMRAAPSRALRHNDPHIRISATS